MIFKKRASLALSVNAIVVVVIAFVVLGLGLALTHQIYEWISGEMPGIIDAGKLKIKPTADNPITFPKNIRLKAKSKLTLDIGFYNKNVDIALDAKFIIDSCLDEDGVPVSDLSLLPTIVSKSQDVPISEAKGYRTILKEKGLPSGKTYVCDLKVIDANNPNIEYETEQVYINIVS